MRVRLYLSLDLPGWCVRPSGAHAALRHLQGAGGYKHACIERFVGCLAAVVGVAGRRRRSASRGELPATHV